VTEPTEDQKYNNTRKMYLTVNQHKFNMIRNKKAELAMNTKEREEI